MQILKKIIKTIAVMVVIFIIYYSSSLAFLHYKGYFYESYIVNFVWNLSRETKIETRILAIDVPIFHWLSHEKNEHAYLAGASFNGIPIFIDNDKNQNLIQKTEVYVEDQNSKGIVPLLWLRMFNKDNLDEWNRKCDKSLTKSTEMISDVEVEIYDCVNTEYEDVPTRYIVYKSYYFELDLYTDTFKPQYDKFFEGVRLKQ